jgi:hypothetical protein
MPGLSKPVKPPHKLLYILANHQEVQRNRLI